MEQFDDIIALEKNLLDASSRKNSALVDSLLCDDFFEIGASGQTYNKSQILNLLSTEEFDAPQSEDFLAISLGEDCVQIRYLTRREELMVRRTSIWQREEGVWRMRFHQGTIV